MVMVETETKDTRRAMQGCGAGQSNRQRVIEMHSYSLHNEILSIDLSIFVTDSVHKMEPNGPFAGPFGAHSGS